MSTRRRDADFAAEIDAHLDTEIARLIDEGLSPDEARVEARRRFGSVTAAKERFYESHRFLWLDHLLQDLRYGSRAIMRYPIACTIAVISLAFGIGATTATLTVRDVVFRKAPPLYRDPSQLSIVQVGSPERPIRASGGLVPGRLFAQWRESRLDTKLVAATPASLHGFRAEDHTGDALRVRAVTPAFFAVLGVDAALGSTMLTPESVVISHRVWRFGFDGRADVVGRTLWIDNKPLVVAGVMPERFWFSSTDSPVWTLLGPDAVAAENALEVVARRPPGVSRRMLEGQLQPAIAAYAATLPAAERQLRLSVSGIEGTPMGRAVSVAIPYLLAAAVLLTLLIACANVAILVIAQWTTREHEIAIRASLGASRGRIMRGLVAESLVIALAGGALGIGVTYALLGVIIRRAGENLRFYDLSIDPWILVASIVITAATGIAAGIGPALLETRRLAGNPMRILASSDRVRQRWRHALVVSEIAVTVAMLVVTGGMINTYQRHMTRDVGFRTRPLVAMRVQNSGGVPADRIVDAVERMPGVVSAAAATSVPYMGSGPLDAVATDAIGTRAVRAERVSIDHAFFTTIDVPMRAGRAFTPGESPVSGTMIINELLAARLFPGESAVGRRVWIKGTPREVVGVVAQYYNTALQSPDWDPKFFLPLPASGANVKQLTFIVRAASDATSVATALRRDVKKAAAGTAVTNLFTLDQVIAVSGQEILVGTAPLAPLIFTGMLLSAAGIYGVLAFAIARRSKELALRVAVGASRRDIVKLVSAHSVRLVAAGTVVGVGFSFIVSRIVRASGGGDSFLDPAWPAFLVPVAIIAVIAIAATLVPSRRALKITPAILLRAQ